MDEYLSSEGPSKRLIRIAGDFIWFGRLQASTTLHWLTSFFKSHVHCGSLWRYKEVYYLE